MAGRFFRSTWTVPPGVTGKRYQRACPDRSIDPDALPCPLPLSVIVAARVQASLSTPPLITLEQAENADVVGNGAGRTIVLAVAVIESPTPMTGSDVATLTGALPVPMPAGIVTGTEPR